MPNTDTIPHLSTPGQLLCELAMIVRLSLIFRRGPRISLSEREDGGVRCCLAIQQVLLLRHTDACNYSEWLDSKVGRIACCQHVFPPISLKEFCAFCTFVVWTWMNHTKEEFLEGMVLYSVAHAKSDGSIYVINETRELNR